MVYVSPCLICVPLATDRDMLAYNIRSDETTVLADGKDKSSQWPLCPSVRLSVCFSVMFIALSLLQFLSVD